MPTEAKIPHLALIIPLRLTKDKDLSFKDIMVLGMLAATNGCLPAGSILTITQIHTYLGRTRQSCYKNIRNLREKGYIEDGMMKKGNWTSLRLTEKFTKLLAKCNNIR